MVAQPDEHAVSAATAKNVDRRIVAPAIERCDAMLISQSQQSKVLTSVSRPYGAARAGNGSSQRTQSFRARCSGKGFGSVGFAGYAPLHVRPLSLSPPIGSNLSVVETKPVPMPDDQRRSGDDENRDDEKPDHPVHDIFPDYSAPSATPRGASSLWLAGENRPLSDRWVLN